MADAAATAAAADATGSPSSPSHPSMESTYQELVDDVTAAFLHDPPSHHLASSHSAPPVIQGRAGVCEDGPSSPRQQQYWIAVVGAPASGKSTTTREVARRLREGKGVPTAVIPMDGYHYYRRELDAMPDPPALHARRGAHWTFNGERFVKELKQARATGAGRFPSFDHHVGDPVEDDIELTPDTRVVLVEGNYLSLPMEPWSQLKDLFNERWLVTCDAAVARARVIARHLGTGNTQEQATRRADDNDARNGALVEAETRRTGWATRVVESR